MVALTHLLPGCACSGKWCGHCGSHQCVEAFHRHKSSPDGRRYACKACRKLESSTETFKAHRRARHKANAEHINEKKRKWYHAHPENARLHRRMSRMRHSQKEKEYEQEYNRSPQGKQRFRSYRVRNPEKVKEAQQRSWYKNHEHNLNQMRVHHARKRALKTGAGGSFTIAEWETLKATCNYTCLACGKREPEIKLTVDHISPVVKLGTSAIENIQPLCLSCNSRKGTKNINYRKEQNYG